MTYRKPSGRRTWVKRAMVFLIVGGVLTLLPRAGDSFVRLSQKSGARVNQLAWSSTRFPVVYEINSAGTEDVAGDGEFAPMRASFSHWQAVGTSRITFSFGGKSDNTPLQNDGRNVLFFDEEGTNFGGGSTTLAFTLVTFSGNRIQDADIVFNGTKTWNLTGSGGGNDVESITTHEAGHFLGLDHATIKDASSRLATMYPFYPGLAHFRTLERDDIAGVSDIYPSGGHTNQTARLSGSVVRPDGSKVWMANMVALQVDSNFRPLVSNLSGYLTGKQGNNGVFKISGLPPGRYVLMVEPLTGDVTDKNLGGIFKDPDTDFQREYYPDKTNRAEARVFNLTAGQEQGSLTVTVGGDGGGGGGGGGGDAFEPNNGPGQATGLEYGKPLSGTIDPAGDVDYFAFEGEKFEKIVLDLDAEILGSPLDAVLTLFGSDGTSVLAENDDADGRDPRISFVVRTTGTHYVRVASANGQAGADHSYRIRLGRVLAGDVDGSGRVDGRDLGRLGRAFGASVGESRYDSGADQDENGVVDGFDLMIVAANFGKGD